MNMLLPSDTLHAGCTGRARTMPIQHQHNAPTALAREARSRLHITFRSLT
jgi:hypothetical protein